MKKLFLLVVCHLVLGSYAQTKYKMELEFKYTVPYCGGVKQSAEEEAESKKEKPLTNYKFYVYRDNKCIDTIKTNENGIAIVRLAAGTYFLFETWKQFKRTPDGSPMKDFFADCLKKAWTKPNYKITIAEGDFKMDYYEVSAGRCPNQYSCLKVRHLPGQIKRNQ